MNTAARRGDRRPRRVRPHPESLVVGALLTALVALGQISTSIYTPSMPSLIDALGATQKQVGASMSSFLFGFAFGQLVFGPLADRWGRRPMLLIGLAAYLVTSIACALAPSIEALIAGRFVQGLAACSGPVLARAVVRDVYGPLRSAKAMAYIGAALAISPAVAPIIGGLLQEAFGWRAAFWFLAVVGAVLIAAAAALLAETRPPRGPPGRGIAALLAGYRTLLASRHYVGCTLAVAFVFSGLMAFAVAAPFVFIDRLGLSPAAFGALAVFTVSGYLAGSVGAGRLAGRLGVDRLMIAGLVLCVFGAAAMAAIGVAGVITVAAIVAPMAVFAAGLGIVLPAGIAAAMAPHPTIAGTASALLGFIQMVVAGAATVVVGALPHASQVPMALVIACGAAAAAAAYLTLAHKAR